LPVYFLCCLIHNLHVYTLITKANHNPIIFNFFKWYTNWKIKKYFHQVKIIGEFQEKNKSILLVSNHNSWWDGFWTLYLNMKIFKHQFFFMMLEKQLKKFWYFNYCGGFSVNKNSSTLIESLQYSAELLSNSQNLVLLFPQGKIESMHQQEIKFEKGLEWILKKTGSSVQIIFLANLIDYFSMPKPTLSIYFQEYSVVDFQTATLERDYNIFFNKCLQNQKQLTE